MLYIYLLNLATPSFRPSILFFTCLLFIASLFLSPQPLEGSDCVLLTFVRPASAQSPVFSRLSAMCLLDKDSKASFSACSHCTSGAPLTAYQSLSKFKGFSSRLQHPHGTFVLRTLCPSHPWLHVIPVSQQGLEIVKGQSPPICADLGHHFLETSFASSLIKAVFASPPAFLAITLIKLIFLCSLFAICINGKFIYSVPNSPVTAL